jgi:thiosulfate dehydrogenase [quinone] large subunit
MTATTAAPTAAPATVGTQTSTQTSTRASAHTSAPAGAHAGTHAGAHASAVPSRLFSQGLIGLTRIAVGFVFLWTFLDKTFGLGHATPRNQAWRDGGSPTAGFLSSRQGTFGELFRSLAGEAWVDWAYMLGMALVGTALILGITMRLAAVGAVGLMGAIYLASLPLAHNPVVDRHLVYAATAVTLALVGAGRHLGLGGWWSGLRPIRKLRWLA